MRSLPMCAILPLEDEVIILIIWRELIIKCCEASVSRDFDLWSQVVASLTKRGLRDDSKRVSISRVATCCLSVYGKHVTPSWSSFIPTLAIHTLAVLRYTDERHEERDTGLKIEKEKDVTTATYIFSLLLCMSFVCLCLPLSISCMYFLQNTAKHIHR